MEPAGSHYHYGQPDDYSANYPYAQTYNVNIPTAHQFQSPHSTPHPLTLPQPSHNTYIADGIESYQTPHTHQAHTQHTQQAHTQQAHTQQIHAQQASGFSPVHSPIHTPIHSVHELQTNISESEIALTEKPENFTIKPSLQPIKSGPIDRPKIHEDPSPMFNPSSWSKLVWLGFAFLNMYTLIASILLIKFYYSELGGNGQMLARSAFLLITAFELLPRLVNIYQINKYTNHSLSLIEGLGVLLAKKEAYLLIGRHHLSQSQVDRLGVTSDMICLLYICWLGFAFVSNLGGLRQRTGKETDHKLLTLGISLSVAIIFLVGRIIWQIIQIARNYHVRRRRKHDLETAQDIYDGYNVPSNVDIVANTAHTEQNSYGGSLFRACILCVFDTVYILIAIDG
ncbi:1291_t:CDS:2 [Paraglomus occultum]|uniref:1291_t:CDS:1 n=1 Tax=Paraglomus occultum TaxID=144539 RepID=A0A9N9F028_9GLOM|nr:1291_t:CDS:2 [Paraglomus occultum]